MKIITFLDRQFSSPKTLYLVCGENGQDMCSSQLHFVMQTQKIDARQMFHPSVYLTTFLISRKKASLAEVQKLVP